MAPPERPTLEGLEEKWSDAWESAGTYRFDRSKPREQVFAIDTPPPTVSGSLHIGSFFGYVQTDAVARARRMRGFEVFYPMGWDDNGVPTERRVQNYFGVRCDPALAYDPAFEPPAEPPSPPLAVSRPNFVELCERLTAEDEQVFEAVWRRAGLSVDWTLTYATIDDRSRRVAQRAFLRNLARGEAYQAEAPTLWDVDFLTAVSQAELEDRERSGAYYAVRFHRPDGDGDVVIETTRPELIPACVALVAHPDDDRYRGLFGTEAVTPLFGVKVPVLAHALADPEKGSGIAMICTFGDTTDVVWWRELQLPSRTIVGRDGHLLADPPDWGDAAPEARDRYAQLAGLTVSQARARIIELLRDSGELVGDPRPVTHAVKFYEKGERPLEIVSSRQWYIRNGGRDPSLRSALLARGRELAWHPPHMRVRYEHWVDGLNSDWLISRQRFFGVPFPVWYRLDADGNPDYDAPLLAPEERLPVDPSSEPPEGFDEDQRGKPSGFVGDPDVMDTWATSSLTPQIACGWETDHDLFARTFPMDLRPQGPEIIRTWLFDTVVRSHLEHGQLPWKHATINGWILDPDRKKMSKSKGNVVTPMALLERYGSDAVRYWAVRARPGVDTAFDEGEMRIGRRLAIKILNASKFVLGVVGEERPPVQDVDHAVDRSMLGALRDVVETTTRSFDEFDYARALEVTERFFWGFCDDYLELVKQRAYGSRGGESARSAAAALTCTLSSLLRLFAPHLPFVTEEVWSWWQDGSVHRARWPERADLGVAGDDTSVYDVAATVLGEIRKAKSGAKRSMRTEVTSARIEVPPELSAPLALALDDVRDAGRIVADVVVDAGDELRVEVELADPDEA